MMMSCGSLLTVATFSPGRRTEAGQLNTYDVLVADEVVFTAEALDEFLGVPAAAEEADK